MSSTGPADRQATCRYCGHTVVLSKHGWRLDGTSSSTYHCEAAPLGYHGVDKRRPERKDAAMTWDGVPEHRNLQPGDPRVPDLSPGPSAARYLSDSAARRSRLEEMLMEPLQGSHSMAPQRVFRTGTSDQIVFLIEEEASRLGITGLTHAQRPSDTSLTWSCNTRNAHEQFAADRLCAYASGLSDGSAMPPGAGPGTAASAVQRPAPEVMYGPADAGMPPDPFSGTQIGAVAQAEMFRSLTQEGGFSESQALYYMACLTQVGLALHLGRFSTGDLPPWPPERT